MAVVLDPRTGDVLAMAMRPTFNPNAFLDVPSSDAWRNRAVTDPFEPGSTFKAILAAAALEEGVVRPDDRIYAENGAITLAGTTIRDWKKYGWLTFAEVLQNSSNVGSIKVGMSLGRERYYRVHEGVRLRRADRRRPRRREPRAAARAAALVAPVAADDVDRSGNLGDGAPAGDGVRRHRERRHADAAPPRPVDASTPTARRLAASKPRRCGRSSRRPPRGRSRIC